MGGKRQERMFVARNVGENAAKETRFFRRSADRAGVDPGQCKEARKLLSFARDKSERRDGQFERCAALIRPRPSRSRGTEGLGRSLPGPIAFHLPIYIGRKLMLAALPSVPSAIRHSVVPCSNLTM
jgi:hypothetical protein